MFWTHWNLSALRSFYGLAASGLETEYNKFWVVFFRAFLVFLRIHFSVFILSFKKLFFSVLWAIIILFMQLQAVEIIYWLLLLLSRWFDDSLFWLVGQMTLMNRGEGGSGGWSGFAFLIA
jgi:hypothetical protein